MRIRGERCSAHMPSTGYFCDTGAKGRYKEQVWIWNGEIVECASRRLDVVEGTVLSDLCFLELDLEPSSLRSLFRFFSPCVDLCFLSPFDLFFFESIADDCNFAGFSIDMLPNLFGVESCVLRQWSKVDIFFPAQGCRIYIPASAGESGWKLWTGSEPRDLQHLNL